MRVTLQRLKTCVELLVCLVGWLTGKSVGLRKFTKISSFVSIFQANVRNFRLTIHHHLSRPSQLFSGPDDYHVRASVSVSTVIWELTYNL